MGERYSFRDDLARLWAAGLPFGAVFSIGKGRRAAIDPATVLAELTEQQAIGLLCTVRRALFASVVTALTEPDRASFFADRLSGLLEQFEEPAIGAVGPQAVTHLDIDVVPDPGDGAGRRLRVPAREFKGEQLECGLDGNVHLHRPARCQPGCRFAPSDRRQTSPLRQC